MKQRKNILIFVVFFIISYFISYIFITDLLRPPKNPAKWPITQSVGGISIKFPRKPLAKSETSTKQSIKSEYSQYTTSVGSDAYLLRINKYLDFNITKFDSNIINTMLQDSVKGAVGADPANQLKSEKYINFQDKVAVTYLIYNTNKKLYFQGINIIHNGYFVSLAVTSKQDPKKLYDDFISTLKLN